MASETPLLGAKELDAAIDQVSRWKFPGGEEVARLQRLLAFRLGPGLGRCMLASTVRAYQEAVVIVHGHTDRTGDSQDEGVVVVAHLGRRDMLLDDFQDGWTKMGVTVDDGNGKIGQVALLGRGSGEREVLPRVVARTPARYAHTHGAILSGRFYGTTATTYDVLPEERALELMAQACRILGSCAADPEHTALYNQARTSDAFSRLVPIEG